MNLRIIVLLGTISLFSLVGCPESQPEVTVMVTDCPKADIVMTPTVTVSGSSRRWPVKVQVTITCRGIPANGAEIKVKYPWLPAFTTQTDAQGNAQTIRVSSQDPRPTGSLDVTIEGSDGSISQSVSY